MNDRGDERLIGWLERTALASDPATLTRALARLRAERETPAWLRWFARPVALWSAAGLLCASVMFSAWILTATSPAVGVSQTPSSDVIGHLLGDDGSMGLPPRGIDSTRGGL